MMLIILLICCAVFVVMSIKWKIAALTLSHYLAKNNIIPTDEELKESTIFVIRKLLHI